MTRLIIPALVALLVSGQFEDLAAPLDRDGRPPE